MFIISINTTYTYYNSGSFGSLTELKKKNFQQKSVISLMLLLELMYVLSFDINRNICKLLTYFQSLMNFFNNFLVFGFFFSLLLIDQNNTISIKKKDIEWYMIL